MSSRVRPSPSGEWEDHLGGPRPRPYCSVRAGHSSLPIQWTPALSGPGSRKWDSATRRDVFPHDLDRRVRKPGLPGDPGRRPSAPLPASGREGRSRRQERQAGRGPPGSVPAAGTGEGSPPYLRPRPPIRRRPRTPQGRGTRPPALGPGSVAQEARAAGSRRLGGRAGG